MEQGMLADKAMLAAKIFFSVGIAIGVISLLAGLNNSEFVLFVSILLWTSLLFLGIEGALRIGSRFVFWEKVFDISKISLALGVVFVFIVEFAPVPAYVSEAADFLAELLVFIAIILFIPASIWKLAMIKWHQ